MNNWFGDSAHVLHVAKTGNDANAGHAQGYPVDFANDAKLTLGSAISAAASGDIIIIWPGTYAEFVDLDNAAKQLHLIGTHRHLCKITGVDDDNEPVVHNYEGCILESLTIENGESGEACVYGVLCDDTKYLNCTIIDTVGIDTLIGDSSKRMVVRDCYLYSVYHNLRVGDGAHIENCTLITVTDGAVDGWCIGAGGPDVIIVRNTYMIVQPSYGKAPPKSPPLYEATGDQICISSAGRVMLENCILVADAYKPLTAHADSYCSGTPYCIYNLPGGLTAVNCLFKSWADQNQAADAVGIYNANTSLLNCALDMNCSGSGSIKYFDAASAKVIHCMNTRYDPSEIGANIKVELGRNMELAMKMLVNKAVQTKATGVVQHYDDDGSTVILTHTPTDAAADITRTPS